MLKKPRITIAVVLTAFISTSVPAPVYAQSVHQMPSMPTPGAMVHLSREYTPTILKGIVIHPEDAFKFDFLIDQGDAQLSPAQAQEEYKKLIKYFMASLAVPDNDQWVNLSPYEKDRIIMQDFGKTAMGRDLLAQDYMLKQITASLIYPGDHLGREFWDKVYAQAQQQYGNINIPVNTFNKVWIVPDSALIYEKGNMAYVVKHHLKVMLEEDYLSLQQHNGINTNSINNHTVASKVVRELILPALEKEVNEGKNFAPLRQVYSGMILAAWFKRALKESILTKLYANQNKINGIDLNSRDNEVIYQQYLKAYKKGVFNFIKEDVNQYTHQRVPRKYFSGGAVGDSQVYQREARFTNNAALIQSKGLIAVTAAMNSVNVDGLNVVVPNKKYQVTLKGSRYPTIVELGERPGELQIRGLSPQAVDSDALKGNLRAIHNGDTPEQRYIDLRSVISVMGRDGVLYVTVDRGSYPFKTVIVSAQGIKIKPNFNFHDALVLVSGLRGHAHFTAGKDTIEYERRLDLLVPEIKLASKTISENDIKEVAKRVKIKVKIALDKRGIFIITPDSAMINAPGRLMNQEVFQSDRTAKGGIDFNASNLKMQIKYDGKAMQLPVNQLDLAMLRIEGLFPVILDVRPASALPAVAELQN